MVPGWTLAFIRITGPVTSCVPPPPCPPTESATGSEPFSAPCLAPAKDCVRDTGLCIRLPLTLWGRVSSRWVRPRMFLRNCTGRRVAVWGAGDKLFSHGTGAGERSAEGAGEQQHEVWGRVSGTAERVAPGGGGRRDQGREDQEAPRGRSRRAPDRRWRKSVAGVEGGGARAARFAGGGEGTSPAGFRASEAGPGAGPRRSGAGRRRGDSVAGRGPSRGRGGAVRG